MKVGLLGDVHSNFPWIHYAIDFFHRQGISTVLQAGDLGVWPGKIYAIKWNEVQAHLDAVGQAWLVTPGNHEDYDQIDKLEPDDSTGWLAFRENIIILPRGARWEMGNLSFVSLGGANSIDRTWRREASRKANKPPVWWEHESITQQDVANAVAGGYADVMICHDAPNNVEGIERRIKSNPLGAPHADLIYAQAGRDLMDIAFHAIAPKLFIHGHYHFRVDEPKMVRRDDELAYCRIFGLNKDEEMFNFGVLDTETGEAEFLDHRKDHALNRDWHAPKSWAKYLREADKDQ